ncbi:7TM diverse intracellular signaling domain-containing protein [Pseudomonas sp. LRF_L74]|uniref:hybrid sensor histidine kinase/response regulator n=1 Tax=Pseudomonas sp. LRF_L74 TaxID=3369422 RepID=UPI003F5E6BF1
MRYALFFLLCFQAMFARAVDFDEFTRSVALGPHMDIFEDVRGEASISDILSPALSGNFRRHAGQVLNAGYTRSAYWLRVDLNYQPMSRDKERLWYLELAYPPLDRVDLYLPDEHGGYRLAQRSGDTLPFNSRQVKQNNYVFEVDLTAHQTKRIYLRLQSEGSMQAPLILWSPKAYLEDQPQRIYVLGIIYGVLLVMLFYNLFIFVSVRDTSYLYYILYIASFGLYQVSVNGAGIQYLWPNNPWWANASTPFLVGATALFGSQFARSFLHTASHSRWVDRILLVLMGCGVLVMGLALTAGYGLSLRLATYLALAFTVMIFFAGILAWLRGLRVARYFIIAWTAFLVGGAINTLMVLGYLPNVFLTMYASQIGSALEVGLLSLALADRINAMKEERTRLLEQTGRELELLNRELADSNRLKDEFLATVTHELRTPMNGVIGSLELMQTLDLSVELAQYQRTAANSARDMMCMVDDILMLTELQAGRLYARREPFSLRGLFDGLRVQHGPGAIAKGLTFNIDLESGLPDTLEGDAGKLAQSLGYLLDNAIKFTHEGGVAVTVAAAGPMTSSIPLRIEVQDSGIGFSMPDSNLYQSFKQFDGSMTRRYGGLGIGLAICRQLVELQGGSLQHQSRPGEGSTFAISLLLKLPEQSTPVDFPLRRPGGWPQRQPGECTILVVEDNAINQLVTRGMLLKLGYRVRTADNGVEALERLDSEPVDAVLLDCQMPVMDGFAACRSIRGIPRFADLPVIALTAHSQVGDRERCLAAGMSDYMAKPTKFVELQTMLHDWVLCRKDSGKPEA